MTSEEYKKLSLLEFDKAAAKFDDNDPSVYNMCRKDYPDVLAEVVSKPFKDLLDKMTIRLIQVNGLDTGKKTA